MNDTRPWVLHDAWRQCEGHLHHLHHALASLKPVLPATVGGLATMDDEVVQDWDEALRAAYLNEAVNAVPQLVAVLTTIKPLVSGLPSAA